MKSDAVKKGIERAAHRSLLLAVGVSRSDLDKPFVGIINSFSEIVPGHIHLRGIAEAVKQGVARGGGIPFEVNTIAVWNISRRTWRMNPRLTNVPIYPRNTTVMTLHIS